MTSWTLDSFQDLGIDGVSPHLEEGIGLTDHPYFLYSSSFGRGGLAIDGASKDLVLSEQAIIDGHSDLTIVTLKDGSRKAYFVDRGEIPGGEIYGANIANDGITLSNEFKTNIANEKSKRAWGVPDSVVLPDGRVRIYWVDDPNKDTRADEVIRSATSSDASGLSFVIDEGYRASGGYVDFEVLRAETNNWLAIMSSTPATIPDKRQGLFIGTSNDGLKWSIDPTDIAPSDSLSYLDPTGIEVDENPNQWRIILSSSPSILGDREYSLNHAILSYNLTEKNSGSSSSSNELYPTPESIQTDDGFTQFTDADDTLMGQADIKFRLMEGSDFLEITGGINNFANGNIGDDRFILRSGEAGQYLGGTGSDTFEVFGGIENDVNGHKGDDIIALNGGQGRYRGGDNNDKIDIFNAEAGSFINGNNGQDNITGSVGGVIYRGGKDNDTLAVSQGEAWGDLGNDVFRGVKGDGYVLIQDYTKGEDIVELSMNGSWSQEKSGLMFTDDSGDQIMLLLGINDIEQVIVI